VRSGLEAGESIVVALDDKEIVAGARAVASAESGAAR
jgi:hypothetical protein